MRKVLSKVLAVGLAAGVVLAQGNLASAALTNVDGQEPQIVDENGNAANPDTVNGVTGTKMEFEGHVNKNIIKAVVPTISNPRMYNAILDPEGLIAATNVEIFNEDGSSAGFKYFNVTSTESVTRDGDGARMGETGPYTFENGTLYFKNQTQKYNEDGTPLEGQYDYSFSPRSDSLTITNKGTVPLDIALNVTLKDQVGLEIAESDEFKGNVASVYMAVTDDKGITPVKATGDDPANPVYKASVKSFVQGADEGLYHVTGAEGSNGDGSYKFVENDNAEGFSAYSFQLTGACNPNGIYSDPTISAGTIDVVWTLNEAYKTTDAPVAAQYVDDGTNKLIQVYADKNGATIIGDVSDSATKAAYKFDSTSVKVAGPGMDIANAVDVAGELKTLDSGNPDSQVVQITRTALANAILGDTTNGGSELADPKHANDVIGGTYRILYKVGSIEFAGVVEIPANEAE